MKKITYLMAVTTVTAILCCTTDAFSQSQPQDQSSSAGSRQKQRRELSDPNMKSKLQSDVTSRNADVGNSSVQWWDTGNGYSGTYSKDNSDYMVAYDQRGNYIGTFKKAEWNDQVPQDVRSSFDKSKYSNQQVSSYWTSEDPGNTNYYMELKDNSGKNSDVWGDGNGQLSTMAPNSSRSTPTQSPGRPESPNK